MTVREYRESDLPRMAEIWNGVVTDGVAFPQEETLDETAAKNFFASQTYSGVAETENGVVGLYILHPNNVGRCGHICNASFAVSKKCRGEHIGESLVRDCIEKAREKGFGILQFNAVVETNASARHLYEKLGFCKLGTVPNGFRLSDGSYENICLYYYEL